MTVTTIEDAISFISQTSSAHRDTIMAEAARAQSQCDQAAARPFAIGDQVRLPTLKESIGSIIRIHSPSGRVQVKAGAVTIGLPATLVRKFASAAPNHDHERWP